MYIICVNDGAVMAAWKKDQGLAGSDLIEFVADTHATLTDALGAPTPALKWPPRVGGRGRGRGGEWGASVAT